MDVASKFGGVAHFFHKNSENMLIALQTFLADIQLAPNLRKLTPSIVVSDNASEYCGVHTPFYQYLLESKIKLQTVGVDSSLLNRIERYHAELMDRTRTVLYHCGLPPALVWKQALIYSGQSMNYTVATNGTIPPFEALFKVKVSTVYLRFKGCLVYYLGFLEPIPYFEN